MQRFDWVPEADWDAATGTIKPEFGQKVKDAFAFKAEQEVRKASLPKTPDEYEVALPADFKLPQGLEKFEFNKDDPVLKHARDLALQRGLDKDGFKDFLGLYAANKIAEMTQINQARQAEIAKLGSAGPQRIDALRTWTTAKLGPDLAGAIDQMLVTAKQVEAFEKIIDQFSRQGGTQFTQGARQQQEDPGTIPGYEQMDFKQRRIAQMTQRAAASGR